MHIETIKQMATSTRVVGDEFNFREVPEQDKPAPAPSNDINTPVNGVLASSPCNIIYSSGTTGSPKGIVHSYQSRLYFALLLAQAFGFGRDSITLISTPLYTNGTWLALMPTVLAGGTSVVMSQFDTGQFFELAKRHRVTHSFLVPAQFKVLIDRLDETRIDAPEFKVMISAGSPMPANLRGRIEESFGRCLYELYGLTEGIGTVLTPAESIARTAGCVGRPLPLMEFRVVSEDGIELPPMEVGEIVGRGPALMTGYLNRPDLDLELTWTDSQRQTYLRTGDLGFLDASGFVHLRGRQKDMIVSGGLNIYPADIEEVLNQHADLIESAVIGASHARWGETPVAVVCVAPGAAVQAAEILSWANLQLAKHQRLTRAIIITQPLPRNALGKVVKLSLLDKLSELTAISDTDQ